MDKLPLRLLDGTGALAITGAFSASNVTGTNTGDQTTITGNAGSATKLSTARTLTITGDLTWTSPSFDGTGDVTAAATLPTVNSNTGSFGSTALVPVLTVNAKGLITAVTTANIGAVYAPLASPALTGTPTAPTAASADNSTTIATTAFVKTAVAGVSGSSASTDNVRLTGTTTFGTTAAYTINGSTGMLTIRDISVAQNLTLSSGYITCSGYYHPSSGYSEFPTGLRVGGKTPFGYLTGYGYGGAVTQATSKSTGVTLNMASGAITLSSASLAANTGVAFTVTNSMVAATDVIHINLRSGNASAGSYDYQIDKVAAGSFVVWLQNTTAGALSEALVFNFAVMKSAVS